MSLTRLIGIVICAGVVTSLTDWFFAGDWLHKRYTYRETWRDNAETRAIALSSPLPFLTAAAFVGLSAWLHLHTVAANLKLAVAVWLIGPLPLILVNAAWMKLHRVFVLSSIVGWLVKLLLIALACGWFAA